MNSFEKDEEQICKTDKPTIQNLAEFFGWKRDKAVKVKITETEIAPNGTRRERRINNNFVPEESEGENYIYEINQELKR